MKSYLFAVVLVVCALASSGWAQDENPLAPHAQHPFLGVFEGDNMRVEINVGGEKSEYAGVMTIGGKQYKIVGDAKDGTLHGTFVVGTKSYEFDATLQGNVFMLTSDRALHTLTRVENATPTPAQPETPKPTTPKNDPPKSDVPGHEPPRVDQPGAAAPGGKIGGIGIAFDPRDGALVVSAIMPGSPAEKAGVKPGGVLRAVNGKSIENMPPEQVAASIRGEPGTMVTITLETETEVQDVILQRAELKMPTQQPGDNNREPEPMPRPMPQPQPGAPGKDPGQANNPTAPQQPGGMQPLAWMKPGNVITLWAGSASIPGVRQTLEPSDDGDWIDKATGQKYKPTDTAGAGGTGYQQLIIHDVRDGMVVCDARSWAIDPAGGGVTSVPVTALVIPIAPQIGANDYWMHPEQLRRMEENRTGDVRVMRMPYPLNGKTYNAIRIQTKIGSGWTQHTYDLDSGLTLSIGSATVGKGNWTPGANGKADAGAGATSITQGFLVSVREAKLPWIGTTLPRGMMNMRQVAMTGARTLEVQNAGQSRWNLRSQWDFNRVTPSYLQARITTQMDYGNGSPQIPETHDTTLVASSMWIDPKVLARLQPNQVMDEDPVTKVRTLIQGNGQQIAIMQQAQNESSQLVYDLNSGHLVGAVVQTRNGSGLTTTSVQVTDRR